MLFNLLTRIFKMSKPTKRVKVNPRKNALLLDKESLKKLSHEELIERVVKLETHNHQLKNLIKKNFEKPLGEHNKRIRKKLDFDVLPKRHVFLKFYYLGWHYQGLVIQEDTHNTVEHHIIYALEKCALIESRKQCNYQQCGRTDKSVSAFSQVISLDLRSRLPEPTPENVEYEYPYCSMLNRLLPSDIKCYAWAHVSSSTSARFSCSSRMYKYYFPKGNLDIKMMREGAMLLLGSHDFRNFCKMDVGNGVVQFIRTITFVDIRPHSSGESKNSDNQMFEFVIQGNSFLYHQIRYIMSVLFLIGQGKESPDIISRLLDVEENPCKPQYNPAYPVPLNLFDVEFEGVVNNWNIDKNALTNAMQHLQKQWTDYKIKCTMIKDIMENLEKKCGSPCIIEKISDSLTPKGKNKTYKPLFSRPKCGSLEEKIQYYSKRGKIEVVQA